MQDSNWTLAPGGRNLSMYLTKGCSTQMLLLLITALDSPYHHIQTENQQSQKSSAFCLCANIIYILLHHLSYDNLR